MEERLKEASFYLKRALELVHKLGPPPRNVEVKWVMRQEVLGLLRSDMYEQRMGQYLQQTSTFQTTLLGIPIRTDVTRARDDIELVFSA